MENLITCCKYVMLLSVLTYSFDFHVLKRFLIVRVSWKYNKMTKYFMI
jgi:hypothetical protein